MMVFWPRRPKSASLCKNSSNHAKAEFILKRVVSVAYLGVAKVHGYNKVASCNVIRLLFMMIIINIIVIVIIIIIITTTSTSAATVIIIICIIIHLFFQDEFCVRAEGILHYVESVFIKKLIVAVLKANKAKTTEK